MMSIKRILLLLIITYGGIISCTNSTVAREETFEVTGYDFTEYTEKGFLFTPNTYSGEYKSTGLITVTQWPRVHKTTKQVRDANGRLTTVNDYFAEPVDVGKLSVKCIKSQKKWEPMLLLSSM